MKLCNETVSLKRWEMKPQLRLALPKSYYLRAVCYCAINDACGGVPFGFIVMLGNWVLEIWMLWTERNGGNAGE